MVSVAVKRVDAGAAEIERAGGSRSDNNVVNEFVSAGILNFKRAGGVDREITGDVNFAGAGRTYNLASRPLSYRSGKTVPVTVMAVSMPLSSNTTLSPR